MSKSNSAVVIDEQRCKGCDLCSDACRQGILQLSSQVNAKGYNYALLTDWQRCIGCMRCAIICPDACITVYRCRE